MIQPAFRKHLLRLVLVPVVALAAVVGVLLLQIQSLRGSAAWVDHTDLVAAQTNELLGLFVDQETGLRGYLLTGEPQFLEPYTRAAGQIPAALDRLQSLTADNPQQQSSIAELRQEYAQWAQLAAERLHGHSQKALLLQEAELGKQRMDRIRATIRTMLDREARLRAERLARNLFFLRLTFFVLGISCAIAAALIAWVSVRQARLLSASYDRRIGEVQRERDWLNTVLRSIGDGVIACDADGNLVFLNGVAERLTGWTAAEGLGRPIQEIFHIVNERTRDVVENPIEEVRRTGEIARLANHTILLRKDGAEIPISDSGAPIHDRNGKMAGAVLVFRDISHRRSQEREIERASEALRRTVAETRAWAEEMSSVLELAPGIILIAHDRECLRVTSSSLARSMQITPEGKSISKAAPPELRPDNYRAVRDGREVPLEELPLQRAAATGQEQRDVELTLEFNDGVIRHLFGSAAPLLDEAGAPRGAVGVFIDVTEQRNSAEALRRAEKIAVAGRLAASVAHEINNPLEALTNLLYLASSAESIERVRELINVGQDQIHRAAAIVTQTLQFHRATAGARPFSVPDLLDSVLVIWQQRFGGRQIDVVRDYAPTPPLVTYESELRQVIANLVGNASDAMDSAGRLTVRTRMVSNGLENAPRLRITIADTGCGMNRATRRRIFEPFFTTKPTGSGLGLWITSEIVRKHGGALRIRSRTAAPSGTVICLFLPLEPAGAQPAAKNLTTTAD